MSFFSDPNCAGRPPSPSLDRRQALLLAFAATCAIAPKFTFADPLDAADAVTGPITALYDGLVAAMKAGRTESFAMRYDRLSPVVERVFDLPAILRTAVGPRWASLTTDEQTALLNAFRRYTISSYVANFNNFGGERFNILPDRRNVGVSVVVGTEIVPVSGKPARIDYVLRPASADGGGTWKVIDILLDGSLSQVAVQRSEFHGALAEGGAAQLIATIDRKTATLSGAP